MTLKKVILVFVLMSNILFGQVNTCKIFEIKYCNFPFQPRIDPSGIYFISSFDVRNDTIYFNMFDYPISLIYWKNKLIGKENLENNMLTNFVGEKISKYEKDKLKTFRNEIEKINLKKCYTSNSPKFYLDNGGILTNSRGKRIELRVVSKSLLVYSFPFLDKKLDVKLDFPNNLACADFIGIDKYGNSFILIETYISEIPLNITREVLTLSPQGKKLSVLEIPRINYFYTTMDFQIDSEGNLYHLLGEQEKFSILKWVGLNFYTKEKIKYPEEYNYFLHYNNVIQNVTNSNHEYEIKLTEKKLTLSNRNEALKLGEKYVNHKYYCNEVNLAPIAVQGPDSDWVLTPPWLIVGQNATVPYKWGGFNTLTEINNGLQAGKYAGDIHTGGISNYAIGVDCSGFVSRCWQLNYHATTSYMPNITTQYSTWDSLKPADAIHRIGHVRLFIEKNPNGSLKVVESAGRRWNVSYWTFMLSELTSYTPRYYNGMINEYSDKRPNLSSVINISNNRSKINWTCDTSNVKGYRLYRSTNHGLSWAMIIDENVLKTTSVEVERINSSEYYRVSSVSNINNNPESYWSDVKGTGHYSKSKKILIVDGIEREDGGWRGTGNSFSLQYGKVFQNHSISFDCISNSMIVQSKINLNEYDAVYWYLSDESVTTESLNKIEQAKIQNYLEHGGKLFISGSEIGYDLFISGDELDKNFYTNFLKANCYPENAASLVVKGVDGECFKNIEFNIGQTYEENYTDEISCNGGSILCMRYQNEKGAGICFKGSFNSSTDTASVIYLSFPLESTANEGEFSRTITRSLNYFYPELNLSIKENIISHNFFVHQNFPNPFNPTTIISFELSNTSKIVLKVFDVLGREVATLLDEIKKPGSYSCDFDGSKLPSGIYFYRLNSDGYSEIKSMALIK